MFELFELLKNSAKTISTDLEDWFKHLPDNAAWYVVSDYCVNDKKKNNDAYAFEIIANHDTLENISNYISAVAPSDLKSSRSPSYGLRTYLTCPVTFSVTFVVSREAQTLREYIAEDAINAFIPEARLLIKHWAENAPSNAAYFKKFEQRLNQLSLELQRKQRPERLIRQIFLVSTLAAHVLKTLTNVKKPKVIRWISDQDAMFNRHDGLAFDLAYFIWLVAQSSEEELLSAFPMLQFALPGMDGTNNYAELIRLPDYLAGTLADISLADLTFSHSKFPPIFQQVFINSKNNTAIELLGDEERITTRRIGFNV